MSTLSPYRFLLVLLILLGLLAQNFNRSLLIADYHIYKARYLRNCVNKFRPQLKCEGRCQLMKKLEEQEKKEQENSTPKEGFKVIQFLADRPLDNPHEGMVIGCIICNYPHLDSFLPGSGSRTEVFRPPCV